MQWKRNADRSLLNNPLVIIGAGGHGKVIAEIALENGYHSISFVDDKAVGMCMNFPIIGTSADLSKLNDGNTDFVIGIGDNQTRKRIAESNELNYVLLVHPSAQIATSAMIGRGTVIMAGAVVNACTTIGEHCIVNTCAVVEHDNRIADYVHISPKAALGGTVCVGECAHVGIGATVRNNIEICDDCTIGAGAVVVKDIRESATYIGVPAKIRGGVTLNQLSAYTSEWRCAA